MSSNGGDKNKSKAEDDFICTVAAVGTIAAVGLGAYGLWKMFTSEESPPSVEAKGDTLV